MSPRDLVPDALPSLAAGAHDADAGEACVMEYVSLLAGEEWSDRPDCTHPLLAHEARTVNDELGDRDRHLLVPLVGRLFGTTQDTPELTARLRLRQARCAVQLLEPASRPRVQVLLDRAQDAVTGSGVGSAEVGIEMSVEAARTTARAYLPGLDAAGSGPHAQVHRHAARMALVALAGDVDAAQAWALTALVGTHTVAASDGAAECRADCGDTLAHARLRVRELGQLLDEYDAATGREPRRLTTAEFTALADLVDA
ncbi:hypothetical protein V3N99_13165 [Dermatophilaceae bacterium Soc4.6]